jgi:hypothetical protein
VWVKLTCAPPATGQSPPTLSASVCVCACVSVCVPVCVCVPLCVCVCVRRTREESRPSEAQSPKLNTVTSHHRISFNKEHTLSAEEAVIIRIEVIQQPTHSW